MRKSNLLRMMTLIMAILMTITVMSGCGEAEYEEFVSYIDVPNEETDNDISSENASNIS